MKFEISLFLDKKTREYVSEVTGELSESGWTKQIFDARKYELINTHVVDIENKTLSDKIIKDHIYKEEWCFLVKATDIKESLKEYFKYEEEHVVTIGSFQSEEERIDKRKKIFGEGLL